VNEWRNRWSAVTSRRVDFVIRNLPNTNRYAESVLFVDCLQLLLATFCSEEVERIERRPLLLVLLNSKWFRIHPESSLCPYCRKNIVGTNTVNEPKVMIFGVWICVVGHVERWQKIQHDNLSYQRSLNSFSYLAAIDQRGHNFMRKLFLFQIDSRKMLYL
jgi:hypothetical protein